MQRFKNRLQLIIFVYNSCYELLVPYFNSQRLGHLFENEKEDELFSQRKNKTKKLDCIAVTKT